MHISRLREITDFLLEKDQRFQINRLLSNVEGRLNELVSNPQNSPHQTEFAKALKALADVYDQLRAELEPADVESTKEINGQKFFVDDFPAAFRQLLIDNPATPAVARDQINKEIAERRAYVETLTLINDKLKSLGVKSLDLQGDEAEIGFLIPRTMFDNHLDRLIKELGKVNRILRAFSELETGSTESIEVKSISTSDPLFFFGTPTAVIVAVGAVVKWALSVWKDVEEISNLRTQTAKSSLFTADEVEEVFGSKIKKHIDTAIEMKLTNLLGDMKRGGREHEQRTDLRFALEYFLAGIERGLVVQIRHLPPPAGPEQEGVPKDEGAEKLLAASVLAKELSFPAVDRNSAILTLPSEPDGQRKSRQKDSE